MTTLNHIPKNNTSYVNESNSGERHTINALKDDVRFSFHNDGTVSMRMGANDLMSLLSDGEDHSNNMAHKFQTGKSGMGFSPESRSVARLCFAQASVYRVARKIIGRKIY